MPRFFICYSSQNKDKVKALVDDIQDLGYNVWFDEELSGGLEWWDEILVNIRKCDIFMFALSPESLDHSPACKRELKYATDLHKTILPVSVADGVSIKQFPPVLSKKQVIDYRG